MIVTGDDARRPESKLLGKVSGWTSLHSWIFLGIVALGLLVIGIQNRYYYLSPLGLGKAYRIDKVFGGIQEFDPDKGWIKANIQAPPPMPPSAMMNSPMPGAPAMPMNVPGAGSMLSGPAMDLSSPSSRMPSLPKEQPPSRVATKELPPEPAKPAVAVPPPPPKEPVELTEPQKLEAFKKVFPDFGKDEFQLANDDLYPDWKKQVSPKGTWEEFLDVYGAFVQWWSDQGSPPEPGLKLWKDFLTAKPKGE
jgi:hypothetical protein